MQLLFKDLRYVNIGTSLVQERVKFLQSWFVTQIADFFCFHNIGHIHENQVCEVVSLARNPTNNFIKKN